jgi:F-type H+-transporting ATPase subunit gamma
MPTTKEIKNKIESVDNIKQITKAMQLMSVGKMRTATDRALETRPYANKAREILASVTANHRISHPLLTYGKGERTLAVVLASDKGLCGGFNDMIADRLEELTKGDSDSVAVVAVGEETDRFARQLGCEVLASFHDFDENTKLEEVGGIFTAVHEAFLSNRFERVMVVYAHYESALERSPLARQLFPVDPDNMGDTLSGMEDEDPQTNLDTTDYLFEPSDEAVASAVLPRLSRVRLYQALLESQASEHSARMFAMKNATENAEEMGEELETDYNQARQQEVTQEIAEISSAAEALR